MRVFVYFNLHRKCLSVKALEGERKGRVIAHANMVVLHDVTFKVSEAGRQRVIRERRKNVHAGVVGEMYMMDGDMRVLEILENLYSPLKYNPYKFDSFVHAVNETPVRSAKRAVIASVNGRGTIYASE
jgi:hypothetical protein